MQLGELEKQVLQYFWKGRTAEAKSVYAHFEKQRGGTLNTIQSTLDRLFKNGSFPVKNKGMPFNIVQPWIAKLLSPSLSKKLAKITVRILQYPYCSFQHLF